MFQQFKNIFPTAAINLRSLSESVGINDTEWSRGVERIGALRDEFNNILLNRPESSESISASQQSSLGIPSITELKATSQLINNLQSGWDNIQENNQQIFKSAKEADVKLRQLQHTGELHYKVCEMIENSGNDIQHINDNLAIIHEHAANLMDVLTSLEEKIDQVSVNYEKEQFEQWKQNQEMEIAAEIAQKRRILKEREASFREKYEEHERTQRKKRVELYEANFNAELEDYRRRRENEVSSLYSNYSNRSHEEQTISTQLNQVKLVDNDGDLDDFLGQDESTQKGNENTPTLKLKEKKSKTKSRPKTKPKNDNLSSSDEEGNSRVEILADEDYEDL